MRDPTVVRQARDQLRAAVQDRPWYRGIAIARSGGDLVLRLNVSPTTDTRKFPHAYHGIPVEVVRIDGYEPRGI